MSHPAFEAESRELLSFLHGANDGVADSRSGEGDQRVSRCIELCRVRRLDGHQDVVFGQTLRMRESQREDRG